MSNTENTRPKHVLLADLGVPRVNNLDYPEEPLLLSGGAGSSRFGRKSKLVRKQSQKAERRNARSTLRTARLIHPIDTDTIDIQPITKNKVGWRHKPALSVKDHQVVAPAA
jgi:hypothetical protein